MPRLRIFAGPSLTELQPITVNSGVPVHVKNDAYEGDIAVYIKDFDFGDQDGHVKESAYFDERAKTGKTVTWSIQSQGRFLQEHSADEILFGNVFNKPLAIPWGFSAILSFMQYMDPTLEQDLQSKTKPWALSPLISTMPFVVHTRAEELHKVPPFPPLKPIQENTAELKLRDGKQPEYLRDGNNPLARREYFRTVENRKNAVFGPNDVLTTDFCYDYLTFSPTGVTLSLPAGMSLDMMRYWDGQPVYFVCASRPPGRKADGDHPLGKIFWCIAIEVLEEDQQTAIEDGREVAQELNEDLD